VYLNATGTRPLTCGRWTRTGGRRQEDGRRQVWWLWSTGLCNGTCAVRKVADRALCCTPGATRSALLALTRVVYLTLSFGLDVVSPFATLFVVSVVVTASAFRKYL